MQTLDTSPASEHDPALREALAAELHMTAAQLDPQASLLQLGLDSMHLMAWLNKLRKRGFQLTLRELYREPTLAGWSALLRRAAPEQRAPSLHAVWPNMRDSTPFALTPVQHAYLLGRAPQQPLGGVGCHLYQEFDGAGLDAEALEQAVLALIARHPMLQVAFRDDGQQQWRETPYWPGPAVHDLRGLGPKERERQLLALRERLGHRMLAVERGETFDFQLSLLPEGRHRLHVNLDLLILDAASFTLVFEELAALLTGRPLADIQPDYDFRSYLAQWCQESAAARERAQRYWRKRLATLPPAPALPLAQEPERLEQVRIHRRRDKLDPADWQTFKAHASGCGVTATMALATCFAAVLARWSGQPRLLLNLTLFDRQPLHPAVERIIADFTNILLLDLAGEGASFDALARANQNTFADAYEHRHWSGVEAMRELRKERHYPHGAPLVFTSNLGRPLYGADTAHILGEPAWGISQTPQVWIDHLAYEHGGSVWLQWDSNEALFPAGLVDVLFDAYRALVRSLIHDASAWRQPLPDPMPSAQRAIRTRINATAAPIPAGLLHEAFFATAERTPAAAALIHDACSIDYAALADMARRCAGALVAHGVRAGDTVAISMFKGIGQIVAALGVLYAGAVYVPVSLDQPAARRRGIYAAAGATLALICECEQSSIPEAGEATRYLSWQTAVAHPPLAEAPTVDAAQPAYVIYTSGSTGTPKGVVISHRGALNTCAELNRRYGVSASDRVLALSALHFDLSVYDIFGVLGAGGALVLVGEAQRRDPSTWCELLERHRVTLWNSVPALFDMLLTYAEGLDLQAPAGLRLVMLSGDWIGLDLPHRYRAFRADGALVAMGGATEASIWSNAFDVSQVSPHWRSLPYGYPLANQRYRVVDEQGRDCPDWVAGELWIGGAGVALGYFDDAERTARQFVEVDGERWYRTGDLGCYWPDGMLEFLGRRDRQVKIGGHRIELGEIDTALNRVEGVKSGVALALGEREKSLAVFVVAAGAALCDERQAEPALPADYAGLFAAPPRAADQREAARLVADFLLDHLRRHGLDFAGTTAVDEVLAHCGAKPRWRPLLSRWLAHLASQGRLAGNADEGYRRGPDYDVPPWLPCGDDPAYAIAEALIGHHEVIGEILRGHRPAETLLDHPRWSPERLLLDSAGSAEAIDDFADALAALSHRLGRPLRLMEIGARSGLGGESLLQRLTAGQLAYTALDSSQDMVLRARQRLASHAHAKVHRLDTAVLETLRHSADAVWTNNALHRLGAEALDALASLAAPAALIHVLELTGASALSLLSADLLAPAADASSGLRAASDWQALLAARGLRCERTDRIGDQQRLIARAAAVVQQPSARKLSTALTAHLPAYMQPQRVYFLDALPLTANGKIDHKALAARDAGGAEPISAPEAPRDGIEQTVAGLWRTLLDNDQVHRHSHFFQLGGDSLLATRLLGELDKAGYAARLGDLFDYPTLASFAATLHPHAVPTVPALRHAPDARHQPFALTAVQQAYLVGRQPGFALGGAGSHFFIEFKVQQLDAPRLEAAWNRLIARHDMLRAVVRDGRQQVLPEVPAFTLPCHRVASLDGDDGLALRERLSRQVLDPSRWPVFDLQAAQDNGTHSRLYICLDNLFLDGLSMQILLAELEQLYLDPELILEPLTIGFRDYLEYVAGRSPDAAAQAYWERRLGSLPPAPELPLVRDPAEVGVPRFVRLSERLPQEAWRTLKTRAAAAQLTPSALLLAAYASVLSAWSTRRELSLNLTLFDRQPLHPQIEHILGDFTSLLLLAWQPAKGWLDSARRLQQRLWQDLAHRDVSALQVMRELARRRGGAATEMPVVFTSALGFEQDRFLAHASWLKPHWGISQTPQVWLDHQVYESESELRFNWDVVVALFEPRQLRAMFDQYVALLRRLAEDEAAWQLPLEALVPRSDTVPATPPARPPCTAAMPSTVAEEALVEQLRKHFRQVVGRPIARRQNFFEAGASSLQLVQLHIQLQRAGHSKLAVTDLFAHASPHALAVRLGGAAPAECAADPARRAQIEQRRLRRQRRQGGQT